jgi:hypothetical protein
VSKATYYDEQKRALALLTDRLEQWEEEYQRRAASRADDQFTRRSDSIPFLVPPRPAHRLIGRDDQLHSLKQRLLNGKDRGLTALCGLPGAGKTAIVIDLAHDPDILEHFDQGILWARLGRQPDVPAVLGTWAASVGVSAEVVASCAQIAERAAAIHAAIGLRRMLLIIDDAWDSEAALAFKVGGPNCAHLVTTRQVNVALDFAGESVTVIRELDPNQGLDLLAQLSPQAVEVEPEGVRDLVRAVGGLPLALVLIGNCLRRQSYYAQSRRLRETVARLQTAEARLQLAQSQSPLDASPDVPADVLLSLQSTIELSLAALDENTRQALADLSLFPPKPNTFSEAAALAVSDAPANVLDTLVDHNLVESPAPDRYTLHQTIADYASMQGAGLAAVERFVSYYVSYETAHSCEREALEQEAGNIQAAIQLHSGASDRRVYSRG